jgi:hypothetical protein
MKKITINKFGEMGVQVPSLSTCFDLVSLWSDNNNRSELGRICAMAICLCCQDDRLPKKRHLTNIVEYGSSCLNVLLGAGVPVAQILESGMICLYEMADKLPSSQEVSETENFTEPQNPEI